MMKYLSGILTVFLLTIILINQSSALRINELESNPSGQDSGAEWIEIYSEDNVDLNGYYLENGDGGIYNLTGSFSGYLIITFSTLWLDNNNETVYLKQNGNVLDTAGPFSDGKNNDISYSFCEAEWKLVSSTKGNENSCTVNQQSEPLSTQQNNEEENENEEPAIKKVEQKVEPLENMQIENVEQPKKSKISLVKESKNYEVTRTYKTRLGVIYFFIGFCVLITVLIALKKL